MEPMAGHVCSKVQVHRRLSTPSPPAIVRTRGQEGVLEMLLTFIRSDEADEQRGFAAGRGAARHLVSLLGKRGTGAAREQETPLRLLRHLASSLRH